MVSKKHLVLNKKRSGLLTWQKGNASTARPNETQHIAIKDEEVEADMGKGVLIKSPLQMKIQPIQQKTVELKKHLENTSPN